MKKRWFLKLKRSPIPNNIAVVEESSIWNNLIPSHPELPKDIDNSDDNETEEGDDDNDDDDDEDDDLSPEPVEVWKPTICVDFKPFDFLVQQHENTKPTESNTTKYILFCLGLL